MNMESRAPLKVVPSNRPELNLKRSDIEAMAKRVSNWGRWGPDDELGTLNYIGPAELKAAAATVRKGKSISLGLDFNFRGPQTTGWGNRFNPIHVMLATGTDAVAGNQDEGGIRYADDMVSMPLQCGTQWDALGHVFYGDKMWNGYDAKLVDSSGAKKNGMQRERIVGSKKNALVVIRMSVEVGGGSSRIFRKTPARSRRMVSAPSSRKTRRRATGLK